MQGKYKRKAALWMAISFATAMSIQPARAFVAPLVAAPMITTAAGSSYALGALAGMIGVIGAYLTISDTSGNQVAIPLGANERNSVPPPTAAATATPTKAGTPGVDLTGKSCQWGSTVESGGIVTSCTRCLNEYADGGIRICKEVAAEGGLTGKAYTAADKGTAPECPAGYAASGMGCALTNPRKATDDKRCDLLITNGQFATADDLNCSAVADGTKVSPLIRDGKAIAYGMNSSGQPLVFTVAPASTVGDANWVTVQVQEQVQTDTQTQIKTTTVTVDPSTSTITSVQTQTSPGKITSPSASTLPTVTQTGTTTNTSNTPTAQTSSDPVSIDTCGLPGKAPCAIDDTGFASTPKPWESADKPDFNEQKNRLENLTTPDITWADWLPSFFPGVAVQCHSLEFRGQVATGPAAGLDSSAYLDLCPYFDIVRSILGWLFGVGTVIYAWRRFISARAPMGV